MARRSSDSVSLLKPRAHFFKRFQMNLKWDPSQLDFGIFFFSVLSSLVCVQLSWIKCDVTCFRAPIRI